jgi:hypothetical protein
MKNFSGTIQPAVSAELTAANAAEVRRQVTQAFVHLERAHVLGQCSTVQHVRVHANMLAWALRQRQWGECAGQLLRLVGALTKTPFGLVPTGNTGGANVSPFRRMPIPEDLQRVIDEARSRSGRPGDNRLAE